VIRCPSQNEETREFTSTAPHHAVSSGGDGNRDFRLQLQFLHRQHGLLLQDPKPVLVLRANATLLDQFPCPAFGAGAYLADVLFFIPPSFHDFGDEVEALAVGFITDGESILVIESLVGGGISGLDTGGVGGVVSDLECQLLVFFAKGHRRFPPVVTFEKKRRRRDGDRQRCHMGFSLCLIP
jgi:hypothetical protein